MHTNHDSSSQTAAGGGRSGCLPLHVRPLHCARSGRKNASEWRFDAFCRFMADNFHSPVFCNILIGSFYADSAFNFKRNQFDYSVVALAAFCPFVVMRFIKSHKVSMETNLFLIKYFLYIINNSLLTVYVAWMSSQKAVQRRITWKQIKADCACVMTVFSSV